MVKNYAVEVDNNKMVISTPDKLDIGKTYDKIIIADKEGYKRLTGKIKVLDTVKISNKIEGLFDVLLSTGIIVGCMSWETPCLILRHNKTGDTFYWISDKIEEKRLNDNRLIQLKLKAFYRFGQCGQHLYRVNVLEEFYK